MFYFVGGGGGGGSVSRRMPTSPWVLINGDDAPHSIERTSLFRQAILPVTLGRSRTILATTTIVVAAALS